MRITGGIVIMVVAWLCMFSGGCNLVGAGLTKGATMAEEKIAQTIKDKGGGSRTVGPGIELRHVSLSTFTDGTPPAPRLECGR